MIAASAFGANSVAGPVPSFQGLGDLPGGAIGSTASAVSADGSTVVGASRSAESGEFTEAFRWRAQEGMFGLGDIPGGLFKSLARSVSADGSVVVGEGASTATCGNPFSEGFRWTSSSGMEPLGVPDALFCGSYARGISDNAATIMGGFRDPNGAVGETAIGQWLSGSGWQVTVSHSTGNAISRNGEWFGGNTGDSEIDRATRWSQTTGPEDLGFLPGGVHLASAYGASNDGVMVGVSDSSSGVEAFRWSESQGMQALGDLSGGAFSSAAESISADGSTIVGSGTSSAGTEAVLWDSSLTLHRVADVLASNCVLVPTGWLLNSANDITVVGGKIVLCGTGTNPDGNPEAWIARYSIDNGCIGDVTNNNFVNVDDLLAVINSWGACPVPAGSCCLADISPAGGNDFVNVDDLLGVINSWGPCR